MGSVSRNFCSICLLLLIAGGVGNGLRVAVATERIVELGPPGEPAAAFPAPDRAVASIISPIWASEDERRSADETGQVFRLLGIKPGMRVADVGAGSGYYTMLLARAVAPKGEVIAQDITPDYLAALQKRVVKSKLTNIKVGLGEEHDPRLPARSLDAAVLIHMYHEITQPYALLFNLATAMKPESVIGIVDLDRPTDEHGTPPALLRCELAAVGYREAGFHMLKGGVGYLAIFKPPMQAGSPSAIVPCISAR
jgi:SAM-dependent methyltransferase